MSEHFRSRDLNSTSSGYLSITMRRRIVLGKVDTSDNEECIDDTISAALKNLSVQPAEVPVDPSSRSGQDRSSMGATSKSSADQLQHGSCLISMRTGSDVHEGPLHEDLATLPPGVPFMQEHTLKREPLTEGFSQILKNNK